MIDPDLYLELWHQEHAERMRDVAMRQQALEARRSRSEDRRTVPGVRLLASTYRRWSSLIPIRYLPWLSPGGVLRADSDK